MNEDDFYDNDQEITYEQLDRLDTASIVRLWHGVLEMARNPQTRPIVLEGIRRARERNR